MPPVPVEVSEVRPRTVRDQFRALGSIESEATIQVVSELGARVLRLPFEEGQRVPRGELLAQLDDREYRAEAERTEAQRDQARANLERARKLFDQKLTSPQDLENSQTALKVAEASAALAGARLDKTRIRAPFTGLVGVRRVSPGAYLNSGDVITDLTRADVMKVTFSAPERFAGTLRPGIAVEVAAPAVPGEKFSGVLSVVDPVLDPDTRTLRLLARISNRGGKLRPGMSADVYVTLAERPRALAVPDEAVFAEGNQSYVYVVKRDSTVTRTPVELGTRDSMDVEILRGITAGDVVVRAGHQKLFDGAHVMPIPSAAAPAPGAAGAGSAKGGE